MKKTVFRFLRKRLILILAVFIGILLLPNEWVNLTSPPLYPSLERGSSQVEKPTPLPNLTPQHQTSNQVPTKRLRVPLESRVRKPCKVLKIIDGDTISCDLNGNGLLESPNENIRFLQVDTPETKRSKRNPSGKPQPFGLEAKAYTQGLTQNKVVYLEFDKKIRDRYGRTLAWVYLQPTGGTSVNEGLLESGLAKVMIYAPNYAHQDEMKRLERKAQSEKRGLWKLPLNG
jgi:endonuclease YncB( thermonuclease family)